MNRKELLQAVEVNLKSFLRRFKMDPFSYFYEEDARAFFYVQLSERIDIKSYFPTGRFEKEADLEQTILSSPWKAEYPRGQSGRFDIAFLEPSGSNFYELEASIGIEIKLGSEKLGSDQCGGFISDFGCLLDYRQKRKQKAGRFLGVALYLYQTVDDDNIQQWFNNDIKLRCPVVPTSLEDLELKDDSVFGILCPAKSVCPSKCERIYIHSK